jgi:N-methylhydantoinase B
MPAKIIEKKKAAFRQRKIDPVTLDIIENALRNARIEMDATLFRTAMSPGIREQGDAFPLIADHKARMIVGQFGSFIDGFLRAYNGEIEDGDMIWLSDPYSCEGAVSHSNDWLILLPIFRSGRLISWAAMFGHQSDIGGKVPGSIPIDSHSIFEEGVRIPPVKIYKKGQYQEDLVTLVMHQTRKPDWCRADLAALIASCRVAARRVNEICDRFGDDVFVSATEELLQRNHRAMKHLLNVAIGTEKVSFEDYLCDDGVGNGPYKIKCTMWRETKGNNTKVILDFNGTDPQAKASINFLLNENMFKMFFGIYMIMVFDPQILFNDGFYDLVDVRIPEGSLLKPKFPAPLSGRTHALGRIFDILGGLLGQKTPEFLNAAGFSSSPHLMYSGFDKKGEWFQLFQIGFGGIPGRPMGDGPDGHSLWPGFTNVPNEFLERYLPMRIDRYEALADSGGAGKHRGGNGIHMTYTFLEPGMIAIHDDRWFIPPWGVNGGEPGKRARKILERKNGEKITVGNKQDDIIVEAGDQLHFITWGGGGWGDPLERDPALVALEIRRGLVTREGAREYGVVLADDGQVDTAATDALRADIRSKRKGALPLFNYGPDILTLRENCEKETGLKPPVQPQWRKPALLAAE